MCATAIRFDIRPYRIAFIQTIISHICLFHPFARPMKSKPSSGNEKIPNILTLFPSWSTTLLLCLLVFCKKQLYARKIERSNYGMNNGAIKRRYSTSRTFCEMPGQYRNHIGIEGTRTTATETNRNKNAVGKNSRTIMLE